MSRKRNHRMRVANPTSWAGAIARSMPVPEQVVTRTLVNVGVAFERMKNGHGTEDDFDRIACVINIGLIRSESIGQAAVDVMKAAGEAILESNRIRDRHGRFGFRGPDLQRINDAIDLYKQILELSTPNQMEAAVQEGVARMRRGEVQSA